MRKQSATHTHTYTHAHAHAHTHTHTGAHHAHQLGGLLRNLKVLLNLIPWNPVLAAKEAHDYCAPSQESILRFQTIVRSQYKVRTK